jgi:hypothetical protein
MVVRRQKAAGGEQEKEAKKLEELVSLPYEYIHLYMCNANITISSAYQKYLELRGKIHAILMVYFSEYLLRFAKIDITVSPQNKEDFLRETWNFIAEISKYAKHELQ